jgi:hypothetical protein
LRWAAPTPADTDTKGTNMHPSTHQTALGASVADLLAVVGVAGTAGLFATFWDDAWHTEPRWQPSAP